MKNGIGSILLVALIVSLSSTGSHGFSGGAGSKGGNAVKGGTRNIVGGEGTRPESYLIGRHGVGNGLTGGVEKGFADSGVLGNGLTNAGFERGLVGGSHSNGYAGGGVERGLR